MLGSSNTSLLRTRSSVGRYNSTLIDEVYKCRHVYTVERRGRRARYVTPYLTYRREWCKNDSNRSDKEQKVLIQYENRFSKRHYIDHTKK